MKLKLVLLCLVLAAAQSQAAVIVSPDDANIRYTGRWDTSDQLQPWAYWRGTSIIARFEGTSIAATFSAGNTNYIRVIIDDDAGNSTKIPVSSGTATYALATGLTDSVHKIEIVKETDVSRWSFYGFEVDDGKSLVAPPTRPARRISFYGDSNLAGYSLESEQNQSGQKLRGSYYGFAGIVSRMFDAEHENISRSGATIRSLNNVYDRTDYASRDPKWNFSDFQADVVVANIGANDVGRPKKRIKSHYHALLDDLRGSYPDAHILLFNAWGWDYDEPANYIHEVIAERGDPNMSSAIFPWIFEQWHGCEYDHAGMAQGLADHLSSVMGWSQGVRDVTSGLGVNGDVANGSFEEVAPFGGYGWRYYTNSGVSRKFDPASALDGQYFLRLANGAESHQPFPAVPGDTVTVAAWIRAASDGDQVELTLDWRDQEMYTAPLQTETETKTLSAGWQQYTMSATAPIGTARPVFHGRVTFKAGSGDTVDIDDVVLSTSGGSEDTEPPSPDPMLWSSEPAASSETTVDMMAVIGSDPSGVSYFFACVTGNCNSSGWQSGASYIDTGLQPNASYSYQVQARDNSANQNSTGFSTIATATTPGNCTATGIQVQSIVLTTTNVGQGRKSGRASVSVVDDCGASVTGASVTGTFSGRFNESSSALTNGGGVAVIDTSGVQKGKISFTFCVDDITGGSVPYESSSNVETCDSF